MKYKDWFDELGQNSSSIENKYISDNDDNFFSTILEKRISVGADSKIDVFSTASARNNFEIIAIAQSETDYSLLTDEEYQSSIIPMLLTYLEYYIEEDSWKFGYGDVFKKILENRYYFQSDMGNVGFFSIEHFFPTAIHNKDAFKTFMCVPMSDSECEYLKSSGQAQFIKKLKESHVDISDLFRESCL